MFAALPPLFALEYDFANPNAFTSAPASTPSGYLNAHVGGTMATVNERSPSINTRSPSMQDGSVQRSDGDSIYDAMDTDLGEFDCSAKLANEEPGKIILYMDGTHSVSKDGSKMIPINARRVAVKVTSLPNLMQNKPRAQIGGDVEESAVPLCYCKGSEASSVVTIV
jgi:hypothetical protein